MNLCPRPILILGITALLIPLALVGCSGPEPAVPDEPASGFTWIAHGGSKTSNRYAPYDQINQSNVEQLDVQWTWTSPDRALLEDSPSLHTWKYESTPVHHDGVLYTSTSMSQVAAIDAKTGETRWVHNPGTYRRGTPRGSGLATAAWPSGEATRATGCTSGRGTPSWWP